MKYVKYLMALIAACILVMPAFSMPEDNGSAASGQMAEDQQIVPGPVAGQMAQDGQQMQTRQCQKSMKDSKVQGQICPQCGKPMMQQDGQDQQPCSVPRPEFHDASERAGSADGSVPEAHDAAGWPEPAAMPVPEFQDGAARCRVRTP